LVEYLNWRLVFFINAPVGLLGALAAVLLVPKLPRTSPQRFDFAGFVTIALGLSAILLAASRGESWGWTGYRVLILFTVSLLSLATFVVIELEVEHPLIQIRLLRIAHFSLPVALIGLLFINLLGGSFYIPVFLQQVQKKEAFDAGLLILPQAIAMCAVMPISGLLYDRIGPRWLATIGMLVTAYGSYLTSAISPEMTREAVIVWSCVRAAGMGLAIMPMMTAAIDAVPAAETNQGSAILNVVQQVAGALGLATLGALASAQQAQLLADRSSLMRPLPAIGAPNGTPTPEQFATGYRVAEHLTADAVATSYANMFLVLALLPLLCSAAAPFLRSAPASSTSGAKSPSPPAQPKATRPREDATSTSGEDGSVPRPHTPESNLSDILIREPSQTR
jgi:EmrB/QacA subfamily drug resistance transporter